MDTENCTAERANPAGKPAGQGDAATGATRGSNGVALHLNEEDHEAGKEDCNRAAENYIDDRLETKRSDGQRRTLRSWALREAPF